MPELPEVEVTRRSFADQIAGAQVISARMGKPLRWALGIAADELVGRRVDRVERRGKYLLIFMNQGLLLVHLGMSGSLSFVPSNRQPPTARAHDHFELNTTHGLLRLYDPRRFGAVVYVENLAAPMAVKLLGHLGVEPLGDEFDIPTFHAKLKTRSAPIKQVLLAGNIVVGVGNIYACETLFLAGIRPTLAAHKLSLPRCARLREAIVDVLSHAVAAGGSTLKDFSSADGSKGYFQTEAMVYGRAGQPCKVCDTAIKQLRQAQRSTYYCPVCQK